MSAVPLRELAAIIHARAEEVCGGDAEISRVCADSREVAKGDLFVCMPSASRDTHHFLTQAKKAGAVAAIVHSSSGLQYARALGLPALLVSPTGTRFNSVLGRICRHVLGDPTARMRVIGITGTNGKTTTAWILRQALSTLGRTADYLGTLGYGRGESSEPGANTTPFPVDLWNLFDRSAREGATDFVLEASSHALHERRLAGTRFDAGVYLNLSRDHLDFHGTMEAYADSKKLFFTEYAECSAKPFVAVLNIDDPVARAWQADLPCRILSFGEADAELFVAPIQISASEVKLAWQIGGDSGEFTAPLGGAFNAQNVAAAFATLIALGHGLEESAVALKQVKAAPGRFEPVANTRGFSVIVDYAHTPDALAGLLSAVRAVTQGRIICVFGCGGDRDPGKRPLMASVAAAGSDLAVLTSDNPRTEDPARIIADTQAGIPAGTEHIVIVDRRDAIHHAIQLARPGDAVVIAGKGHEDYQIVGKTKYPFDDRLVAQEALS